MGHAIDFCRFQEKLERAPVDLGGAHQAATTACLQRSCFFQASLLVVLGNIRAFPKFQAPGAFFLLWSHTAAQVYPLQLGLNLLMIVTREAGREAVFLDLVVRAIRHGVHLFALAHHGVVQHHIRFPHGSHVGQVGQVAQNKERTAGHPGHRIKQTTKQTTSQWVNGMRWDANQGRFRP